MFKKNLLAASVVLAMGAGAPLTANALTPSPGGTGDALVAPLWVTLGQWETKLQVINTDPERSVVAKLVLWKADDTAEVLDFLLYLSPGDMWEGKITFNDNGTSTMTSTDDSVLAQAGVFATPDNPFVVTFPSNYGYSTIIESASFDLGPAPVAKTAILSAYEAVKDQVVSPANAPINALTGVDILENPANGLQLSQRMEAFNDCDAAIALSLRDVSTFTLSCSGTPASIEAAMAKKHVGFPYQYGSAGLPETIGIFTFPTKDELLNAPSAHPEIQAAKGGADVNGITYTLFVRDMQERRQVGGPSPITSPFPVKGPNTMYDEAQVLFMSSQIDDVNFQKGWAEFLFNADGAGYSGVPVIPSYIYWEQDGSNPRLRGYWESAASWSVNSVDAGQ